MEERLICNQKQITSNFTLQEFAVSQDHPDLASKIEFTEADIHIITNHCRNILEPIRKRFGLVKILSGKRSQELNSAIKGEKDSDHLYSCATDIFMPNVNMYNAYLWIKNNLPYRQVIWYPAENFVHVSSNIPERNFKHEYLIKRGGLYVKS